LLEHCSHARYVWNLAVEQHAWWTSRRGPAPNFAVQCRQLTEARAANPWLAAGSVTVQQQALKDFAQAMSNFFGGTHRRPTWRKAGLHEGFRIVGARGRQWDVRRLSRRTGEVRVPKVGWVRFRWSRAVPDGVKSFRVARDRAGRWHVAFAAIPDPIPAPGNGEAVGVDRGVAVSAALSTGEIRAVPGLAEAGAKRLNRLLRRLARAKRGSNRRARVKAAIARLKAREADRRKDWVEKTSTDLARRFDVIAVEDLNVRGMTRSAKGTIDAPGVNVRAKAGLNRGILANGWGRLAARLEHKAPGRVVRVNPAYTSQTCNACGHCAPENRESQAVFRCVACGWQDQADVNAARNIRDTAVGRTAAARGG
jgi:IS605 OrfB family transposase